MPLFSRGFVRRRAISLATSLSVMATSFALAQNPRHGSEGRQAKDTDERQLLFAADFAMSNMSRGMLMPTGDIDRDFINVMVSHHQGAIDIARAKADHGHDDALRQLARGLVSQQQQDISSLRRALPPAGNSMPSSGAELASYTAK
ncbi:DUF305 domain-containing protein [Bradyrhizobium sp. WSM3983]|uniref:DUF305 domain-containing protein n=1 Tax=Bradyrhizobium sp. WSM3983 TaxID=1038867 RepID=UPI0018DC5C3E|nr:DUF305 domain-containing protein [Bradyrhizobium sp. WSM3983]